MEQRPVYETKEELVAHERSYKAFNVVLRWCMVALATTLVSSTLWFAVGAGFFQGAVAGLIVLALGWYGVVRHEARQPLDPWQPGR